MFPVEPQVTPKIRYAHKQWKGDETKRPDQTSPNPRPLQTRTEQNRPD